MVRIKHWLRRLTRLAAPVKSGERLGYRYHLFQELLTLRPADFWQQKRLLEIGPKDGMDSRRLAGLNPAELVLIDLPEKHEQVQAWLTSLPGPCRYIEANYMYMTAAEHAALGIFDLIWCTGVLYHNSEQLRMLRRLYTMLTPDGYLVLESATSRNPILKDGAFVEIHYPQRYRDTATITHLPTAGAIRAWLMMVGFHEIHDSACYQPENADLIGQRYACIAHKTGVDDGDIYYGGTNNPAYRLGDST